jgi:hypothetical protein
MATVKKEQTVDVKKVMLGMTGERIVAHLLRKQGHIVEESLDPFDSEKDMLMDGLRIEVKTQVPFLVEDSFAVSPSQLKKICNSHRVYFLAVPLSKNQDPNEGCIYELDSTQEFKCHRRFVANGREMVCIPRNQSYMKIIGRVEDPKLLKTLKQLSTSYL